MFDQFVGSLQLPAEVLKLRAKRQEVIAANIGNADTPNYKAVDFKFGDALQAALPKGTLQSSAVALPATLPLQSSNQTTNTNALLRTHSQHFALEGQNPGLGSFLKYRQVVNGSLDNNSVDMDRERAAFAENTVKYEAALRVLNGRVSTLKQAMGSGNQ